jgi:hypothetical protein
MTEALLFGTFFFFLYRLVNQIGKSFPIFELTALLYLLQYGITARLDYRYGVTGEMALPEDIYMPIAVYSSLAFIAGLFVFRPEINFKELYINPDLASILGRVFFVIGLGGSFAIWFLPQSFGATLNLFALLKLPGVFALIFSDKKIDRLLIVVVFINIAFEAVLNALLIEFIVFSIFLSMFLNLRYRITLKIKIAFLLIGFVFLTVYQGVKSDYRDIVWGQEVNTEERIALLSELITFESILETFNNDIEDNESVLSTIHRLNQGWQTSMVYRHVPTVVYYEGGKALLEDVLSSLVPRFLYPNKRVVNDYQRFNYYTGYNLSSDTAMTIGVLGDFYLNFGFTGSLFFLFLAGMFFSKVSQWFYHKFIKPNPINLIWLPFLFSYLIRPGNEFYMVLNHLIKGLIVFFVIKSLYPFFLNLNSSKTSEDIA